MTQSQEQRVKLLRLELDAVIERQRQLIEELMLLRPHKTGRVAEIQMRLDQTQRACLGE